MSRIDAYGIAGFKGRALCQEQGQPGQACLHDIVHIRIAGDDIGEAGLRNRLHRKIVAALGPRGAGYRQRGGRDEGERQYGRCCASPQQSGDAGAEHCDYDGVEQEQGQRPGEENASEVTRFGVCVARAPRVQRGHLKRRDAVGCCERIHRERSVRGAIKSRRMIDRRPVPVIGRQRLGGRGRRAEHAEPVERMQRRHRLLARFAGHASARGRSVAGIVHDPPQHLNERAR